MNDNPKKPFQTEDDEEYLDQLQREYRAREVERTAKAFREAEAQWVNVIHAGGSRYTEEGKAARRVLARARKERKAAYNAWLKVASVRSFASDSRPN